ncbi:MAG: ACP S-malonyltransferase [Lachnospiraceae bacterium]|nr:ACP S-malonyltransferase [Lachnospiraceae bacterium]
MGKIAFLFSGQGAQHPGMGKDLYDNYKEVAALFDAAEALRPGTLAQMFEGDEETLRNTANTQPCLYLADLAAALAMKNAGIVPDMVAGFSLGEIPALAFAGAYTAETGFQVAVARGSHMADAAAKAPAGMAAIVKLPNETVEELASHYSNVYPVNYNCTGQLVVAGSTDELPQFYEEVKAAGGRALPLKVGGGFHSPFMTPAVAEFEKDLTQFEIQTPSLPIYANLTAAPYGDNVRETMCAQVNHPVLWERIILSMAEQGVTTFIETGVGNTLQKLVDKIVPDAKSYAVETKEQLEKVLAELSNR